MKPGQLLIALMLCMSFSVFGLQSKNTTAQNQPKQPAIELIQQQNDTLLKRIEVLEAELKKNPEIIEKKIDDYLDHWIDILAIVMAIVGIAMPLIINIQNERNIQRKLDEASQKADDASNKVKEIERLKTEIDGMKTDIIKSKDEAVKAAKDAMASKYFSQALSVEEKDPSRAIELYSDAIMLREDFYEAYINRGILLAKKSDYNEAEKDFREVINQDDVRDNVAAWAYYNLGLLKSKMNKPNEAISYFSEAINKKYDYAKAFNNRANLYLKDKKYDPALNDANQAIEYDSSDSDFYDTRADIYMEIKMYEKAEENYTEAIERNKNENKQLYGKRAVCYRRLAENEGNQEKKSIYLKKAEDDEAKSQ